MRESSSHLEARVIVVSGVSHGSERPSPSSVRSDSVRAARSPLGVVIVGDADPPVVTDDSRRVSTRVEVDDGVGVGVCSDLNVHSSVELSSREPLNAIGVSKQLLLAPPDAAEARALAGRRCVWPYSDGLRSLRARGLGGRNDTRRSLSEPRPAHSEMKPTVDASLMLAARDASHLSSSDQSVARPFSLMRRRANGSS